MAADWGRLVLSPSFKQDISQLVSTMFMGSSLSGNVSLEWDLLLPPKCRPLFETDGIVLGKSNSSGVNEPLRIWSKTASSASSKSIDLLMPPGGGGSPMASPMKAFKSKRPFCLGKRLVRFLRCAAKKLFSIILFPDANEDEGWGDRQGPADEGVGGGAIGGELLRPLIMGMDEAECGLGESLRLLVAAAAIIKLLAWL